MSAAPRREVSFVVYGQAVPQGSMRAFVINGKPRITSDNAKLKPWRQQVTGTALASGGKKFERDVPLRLQVIFYLDKPKSTKRKWPTVKPDLDKLVRAVKDALKGVLYEDDGQVIWVDATKMYGSPTFTEITLSEMDV